jgi:hypothetical protein
MDLEAAVKALGSALAVVNLLAAKEPDDKELDAAQQGIAAAYQTLSTRRQKELTARHLADLQRRSAEDLEPIDPNRERLLRG